MCTGCIGPVQLTESNEKHTHMILKLLLHGGWHHDHANASDQQEIEGIHESSPCRLLDIRTGLAAESARGIATAAGQLGKHRNEVTSTCPTFIWGKHPNWHNDTKLTSHTWALQQAKIHLNCHRSWMVKLNYWREMIKGYILNTRLIVQFQFFVHIHNCKWPVSNCNENASITCIHGYIFTQVICITKKTCCLITLLLRACVSAKQPHEFWSDRSY